MRIIAGTARGRRLKVVSSPGLRPTGDRQRETLFNVLRDRIAGARVLDLFAGSGALGLEALSRGAAHCVFVEKQRPVVRVLEDNIEATDLGPARVLRTDWRAALRRLSADGERFDLVFVDPPWEMEFRAAQLEQVVAIMGSESVLCLEQPARQSTDPGAALSAFRELQVGDTGFQLMTCVVPLDGDC